MQDLYRCLDQHPPQLLEAIIAVWERALASAVARNGGDAPIGSLDAPLAEPLSPAPDPESREAVERLAAIMLFPPVLAAVIEKLSPDAREVLARLVEEGGAAPGHRLTVRYGAIRRLGPSRLTRERPWDHPENALEELYYQGLIYRVYGSLGHSRNHFYGELLLIPDQLQGQLAALRLTSRVGWTPVEEPPLVRHDGDALAEDLAATLAHIRRHPARLSPEAAAGEDEREGRGRTPPLFRALHLSARLTGEASPERLELLLRALWRLRLAQEDGGVLHPTAKAREWLRLSDARRRRTLFLAWRDDRTWNELRLLLATRGVTVSGEALVQPGYPIATRYALLELVAKQPVGQWVSLPDWVQAVKQQRPDFFRADGDYDSWEIVDAQTREALRGFDTWDRIEGQLAMLILTGPLRWLGLVEVGYQAKQGPPTAFRLTPEGALLLKGGDEAPNQGEGGTRPAAHIDENLIITIPLQETLYERYQLERFAEWQGQDAQATYRITPESVWEGYNAGIKMEQILRFLQRITHDSMPPAVTSTLQAWGGRFGSVHMQRLVLLQTVDEQTMKQITARADIRALLGQRLSPLSCLVEEGNVARLTERLKALGIWPLIK